MKRAWNVLAFLAIVNLLAVGGFVGWLAASDRLSADRLRSVRELLKPTVAEQSAAEARHTAEAEAKAKEAAEAVKRGGVPVSSGQKIEEQRQAQDLLDQQVVRMREESRQLQELIQSKREELERQTAALEAARIEFDKQQAEWKQLSQDEQFLQAVGALEAQKPADAAKVLSAILNVAPLPQNAEQPSQQARKQREIVIRYLASMADRSRAKILAEFIKTDDKLAAELLEDLRKRGELTAAATTGP
ncbi:MAG TPA: hypothetical protein VEB22_08365 [Phycisphaerales bacterium]|nr:hypothetical protein [Phycisphaerales bacterium]